MPSKKPQNDTHAAIAKVLVENRRKARFKELFSALHLDGEKAERFTVLVTAHMMMDRFLTALIVDRMMDSTSDSQKRIELQELVDRIPIAQRIDHARKVRLISKPCATDMFELNGVRNALAHWKPKSAASGWGLGHVPEIASEVNFERCFEKGQRTLHELVEELVKDLR